MKKNASLALLALLLALAGCAEKVEAPPPSHLSLQAVTFAQLAGWENDHQTEALTAFARSCAVITKKASLDLAGKGHDWEPVCAALKAKKPASDADARAFFEQWFRPYAVAQKGLFTGYYEAELNGALERGGPFQTPLWQRPDDLVDVDLGAFRPDLKGQRIAGKIVGHKLAPYDDRTAVTKNGLQGRAKPLLWVDDPVGAFFLEIQGSGRIRLQDGQILHIGFEAQNGHTYVPIGRLLADEGAVARPVTMEKIRAWLRHHPDRAQDLMNRNPSVVFFRRDDSKADGPRGAEGVPLTPTRSLAVDTQFIPLGVPLWLETDVPSLHRLVVAQDTGGAIKGPVRGDLFWGAGPKAEESAGSMQAEGRYIILLPKTLAVHE